MCGRLELAQQRVPRAAPPHPGRQGWRPLAGRASPRAAPPFPFISQSHVSLELEFVLHLALATLEHAQIRAVLV